MSTMVSRATSRWMSTAHWWVRGVLRLGSTTVLEAAENAAGWVRLLGVAVGGLSGGVVASRPPCWPKSVLKVDISLRLTGVQTCALPICVGGGGECRRLGKAAGRRGGGIERGHVGQPSSVLGEIGI